MKISLKSTALILSLFTISWLILSRCEQDVSAEPAPPAADTTALLPIMPPAKADANAILQRPEIPILCYHQVRDYVPSDGSMGRTYIVPPSRFRQQMQALADSGYHSILPSQLDDYLNYGKPLPSKPVMITFDDTRLDQYTAALPVLEKHGFKAAFFIMTVSLGRPGYMSTEQVKHLSDLGHAIGSHTWDHGNVKGYKEEDWIRQVERPSAQLMKITGKKIDHFAYPFGLWNEKAIEELKKRGIKLAFQLSAKRDETDPLHTVRRIIVPGEWSPSSLIRHMQRDFRH